jgi:putative oxidoreductase
VPLIITLVVAYLTSEQDALQKLFSFTDIDPFLNAAPFLFLLACLVLLAFGPGVFSLDYLIGRRRGKKAAAQVPAENPADAHA